VRCYRFNGYWLDIGRIDDYQKAVEDFEENRARFLPGEQAV
jgi:NDP-sugar pyrophosphorylase family protein